MPFLEYSRHRTGLPTERGNRGYTKGIWDNLEDLVAIAQRIGLRDRKVSRKLLSAGLCPGLWRVYYTLKFGAEEDEELTISEFLGRAIRVRRKRRLGKHLEEWVSEANRVYNEFLRSSPPDIAILERIGTPALREFYISRARDLLQEGHPDGFLAGCVMDVEPSLEVFPGLPLTKSSPDGVFQGATPGAIFESKLSPPSYDTFDREIAAYALVTEKVSEDSQPGHGIPVDLAIVLHVGGFAQTPQVVSSRIADSAVQGALRNIELFRVLALDSLASRQPGTVPGKKPATWLDILVRPPGAPTPDKRGPCASCRHQRLCWQEGGIGGAIP